MRLTLLSISFIFVFGANALAQDLDAYKYIIVPRNYDFLRTEDQHQLNSLTKFLFDKQGYTTLMDDDQRPEDLRNNPCLGAKVNVIEISSMLSIKLRIELSNCYDQVVLSTEEGRSKIKDLKRGHHDALRKAFRSIQDQSYRFDQNKSLVGGQLKSKSEPTSTVAEVKEVVESAETKEAPIKTEDLKDKTLHLKIEDSTTKEMRPATSDDFASIKNEEGETVHQKEMKNTPTSENVSSSKTILYAQEIPNGYQLVDSTPKIVFIALKSDQENSYYLKNKAGVLIKQDNSWVAQYYKDGVLVKEVLTIKF